MELNSLREEMEISKIDRFFETQEVEQRAKTQARRTGSDTFDSESSKSMPSSAAQSFRPTASLGASGYHYGLQPRDREDTEEESAEIAQAEVKEEGQEAPFPLTIAELSTSFDRSSKDKLQGRAERSQSHHDSRDTEAQTALTFTELDRLLELDHEHHIDLTLQSEEGHEENLNDVKVNKTYDTTYSASSSVHSLESSIDESINERFLLLQELLEQLLKAIEEAPSVTPGNTRPTTPTTAEERCDQKIGTDDDRKGEAEVLEVVRREEISRTQDTTSAATDTGVDDELVEALQGARIPSKVRTIVSERADTVRSLVRSLFDELSATRSRSRSVRRSSQAKSRETSSIEEEGTGDSSVWFEELQRATEGRMERYVNKLQAREGLPSDRLSELCREVVQRSQMSFDYGTQTESDDFLQAPLVSSSRPTEASLSSFGLSASTVSAANRSSFSESGRTSLSFGQRWKLETEAADLLHLIGKPIERSRKIRQEAFDSLCNQLKDAEKQVKILCIPSSFCIFLQLFFSIYSFSSSSLLPFSVFCISLTAT